MAALVIATVRSFRGVATVAITTFFWCLHSVSHSRLTLATFEPADPLRLLWFSRLCEHFEAWQAVAITTSYRCADWGTKAIRGAMAYSFLLLGEATALFFQSALSTTAKTIQLPTFGLD